MARHDGYHTALNDAPPYPGLVRRTVLKGGIAFQYDLFNTIIPDEYEKCDVLYSDLPWRSGFNKFEQRAGYLGRNYNDFLDVVRWHILEMGKPAIMVTGKHAVSRLQPDKCYESKLNGDAAMALCWNIELENYGNERLILAEIAMRFDTGGDFCCGYGRTAWAFRDAKKKFVVSDYNAGCIAYIGDKMGEVCV